MSVEITFEGNLAFPSDYIGAVDLKERDVTLTIADVKQEDLMLEGGIKKPGKVLYFEKTVKKVVLNKTNSKTIGQLHGTEMRDWIGKRVTFYPTTCKLKGKTVPCIRVRDVVPTTGKAVEDASV